MKNKLLNIKLLENRIISIIFLLIISVLNLNAQYGTNAQITNIDFQLINEKIIITYDLIYAKPNDLFDIEVNIYNSTGYRVEAQSVEGSFTDVKRGKKKQIIWYISEDYNNFEDNIYVELTARHKNYKPINRVTRIEALAKSTLYPGWGSANTTLKKSNYAKGVLGYGFVATSLFFNQLSRKQNSSSSYETEVYRGMSYAMLGAAGVIWIWDYGKVLFSPNISKNIKLDIEACNIQYNFIPLLSLKFNL
ncbi:hypothetical protein ACFLTE_02975 [Bacteroidota bacterium]